MDKDLLLLFILICYIFSIILLINKYKYNKNISNIICHDNNKHIFILLLFIATIAIIIYELKRKDLYSKILIFTLIIFLFLLIYCNENTILHQLFAFLIFILILLFMFRNLFLTKCNIILLISLLLEIILLLFLIIDFYQNIFYFEFLYILNFTLYYLYLHFIEKIHGYELT